MSAIILTNNSKVAENLTCYKIIFKAENSLVILKLARDMLHKGHKLLTHPLVSSLKPNQNPYKTIVLSLEDGEIDLNSLEIMDKALALVEGFNHKPAFKVSPQIDEDLQFIDYELISSALKERALRYVN
ncbi:MAG: GrdX family protein [Spirochaetaceae bacterium]|nr:GrdX family protein [Spirochaetaceae bacterium]